MIKIVGVAFNKMMRILLVICLFIPMHSVVAKQQRLKDERLVNIIKQINQKLLAINDVSNSHQQKDQISVIEPNLNDEFIRFQEGEDLFFILSIDKIVMGELFAIKNKENAKVSLFNLIEILNFPIELSLDGLSASGWFISVENTFSLVIPDGENLPAEVTLNGQKRLVFPQQFSVENGDVYFDADEVSQWFGIYFDFDFANMKINLTSEQPLPIQQRLARSLRDNNSSKFVKNKAILPMIETPYQVLSSPILDIRLSSTIRQEKTDFGYSIVGSNDLAFFNSSYFMNGQSGNDVANARLTLGKESKESDLLGPINATEYSFGDIIPVRTGGRGTSGLSRGFKFTNKPVGRVIDYDQISLNGDIQPNWDIELYRNGILLSTQTSLASGRYTFNDIDLLYGNNQLELVFYGPQGQVERKVEDVFVANTGLNSGELIYSMSLTENNTSLFDISTINNTGQSGWTLASQIGAGINDWMSVGFSQTYESNNGGNEALQSYGVSTTLSLFDKFLVQAGAQTDNNDNLSFQFSTGSQIGNHSIGVEYSQTSNKFTILDENLNVTNTSTQKNNRTNISFAGALYTHNNVNISYQNQLSHIKFSSGDSSQFITNSLAYSGRQMSINNVLNWENSNVNGINSQSLMGNTFIQKRIRGSFARVSSSYSLYPEKEFLSHSAKIDVKVLPNIKSQLALSYAVKTKNLSTRLQLTWLQDNFNLQGSIQTDANDNWRVGLFAGFSFGLTPDLGELYMSKAPLTSYGALAVRVFEDQNTNGVYDEGELLIEGARLKALQNSRFADSNENGIAVLKTMPKQLITDVVLERSSLPDAFLMPVVEGISINPRRGFLGGIDFPVVLAGEIDGTIYVEGADGTQRVAAFATLYLRNKQGDIVASTRSEYDGYYLFTDLLPGDFELSLDAEYLKRNKLRAAKDISIVLSSAGDVMSAMDFNLSNLEFTRGHVVTANSFDSLEMLRAYWYLIQRRYRKEFDEKVFYFQNDKNNKYDLNIGFYELAEQASDACEKLTKADIGCITGPFEFGK
jgi:hypothetical protein